MQTLLTDGFIEELASASPTPGGGGASAAVGMLASALASMVANITRKNKAYEAEHDRMVGLLADLEDARERLAHLAELDAQAFRPLSEAFRLPADTPAQIADKDLRLQSALVQACDVPLDIMRTCAEILAQCRMLARKGSRMAASDAAAAAVFASAAIRGAALNVYVNVKWMTDQALAVHYQSQADQLVRESTPLADDIYQFVVESERA